MEKTTMENATEKNTNSWRIVSSCLKAVSVGATNVVRSAVAAVSSLGNDQKDQVTWVGFDKLKFSPTSTKKVLLIAYTNGFQVIDVEDSDNFNELVSKRGLPVIFLEILPAPLKYNAKEKISSLHPILLVVAAAKEDSCQKPGQNRSINSQSEYCVKPGGTIRFYSFITHSYIKDLSFSSHVLMVRCSPLIIAVGLKSQVFCIDARSFEKKFSVSTYPVPQFERQGQAINTGCGPMAVGPRWLAYAPEIPYVASGGHSKNRNFPGISPSKTPSDSSLMAHFAMQCGKQVATAMMNIGDRGCKALSEHYPGLFSDVDISSVRNGGKTAEEMENAGMVAVKDVLSTAIITQFRAHTTPISALCFDPSGTLLVTASIHGNNINIFRIMPLARCNGSTSYDWNSSHIHLYKLYRGITSAMIRDICFSHCCRWVSIISSKGTCHIFVLPPLLGNSIVKTCDSNVKNTSSSWPWWSTSSFTLKEKKSSPSLPSNFTAAARIKDTNFSLLHLKNVAAASATGMKLAPSGALAATFHASTVDEGLHDLHPATSSLEHLLVFTSSGFVVQYKLLRSATTELFDVSAKVQPILHVNTQDDPKMVFRVNIEPVQWWDVCRRSDHSEGHDYSLGTNMNEVENSENDEMFLEESVGLDKSVKNDQIKADEIPNWYILKAEVQMHPARVPMWQRSKVFFHVITPISQGFSYGELEIEKLPSSEVKIKENDLQPVFGHSPWVKKKYTSHRRDGFDYESSNCSSLLNEKRLYTNPASNRGASTQTKNLLDLDLLSDDYSLSHEETDAPAEVPTRKSAGSGLVSKDTYHNYINNNNNSNNELENSSVSFAEEEEEEEEEEESEEEEKDEEEPEEEEEEDDDGGIRGLFGLYDD